MDSKVKEEVKIICPLCKKSSKVGTVVSTRDLTGRVVKRKYCTNCMVEFDTGGTMYPPLH